MKSKFREVDSSILFNQPNIRFYEKTIPAQDFSLPYLNQNKTLRLSERLSRIVLLCFWKEALVNSETAICLLDSFQQKDHFGDIDVIAINCDEFKPDFINFYDKLTKIDLLWDDKSQVAQMYKINQYPSTTIIDQQGLIVDEKTGGPLNDWARLTRKLQDLQKHEV